MSLVMVLVAVIPASAAPGQTEMYECNNHSHVFDRRQCPENRTYPPGAFPGGGGGQQHGGLLGTIGHILGDVGGLL